MRFIQSSKDMKKIIILACCLLWLAGCSSSKVGIEKYRDQSEEQIFQEADQALLKQDFTEAIDRYDALQILYPLGVSAQQTLLNLAYAHYEEGQFEAAVIAANRYIRYYPQEKNVDYAYYLKALSEFKQNFGFLERHLPIDVSTRELSSVRQSYNDFKTLVTLFPQSVYAPDAQKRMTFLRMLLARHELAIADYYYARKAYVASAERATQIVQEYADTAEYSAALKILMQSREALGLPAKT